MDQLQSAELSFLLSGMLKGRLTRRVGVVRVLGGSGRVGPRAVTGAFRDACWSGGDLGQYGSAAAAAAAAARWALGCVHRPRGAAAEMLHVGPDKVSYLLGTGQLRSIKIAA